jgi:hypothetical protein
LIWSELVTTVYSVLRQKGRDLVKADDNERTFGIITGILLLKADLSQLKELTRLPDTLIALGLESAAVALWYALGHEDQLPDDMRGAENEAKQKDFFSKWYGQPAADQLPDKPELCEGPTVHLSSRILGCHVQVECDNQPPCVETAESILAALESMLSTGELRHFAAVEPLLLISVRKGESTPFPFSVTFTEADGLPKIEISCQDFSPHQLSVAAHQKIKEELMQLLAQVTARVFIFGDPQEGLAQLFGEERAMERAVHFTGSFVTVGNVLGHHPKLILADWNRAEAKDYPLMRTDVWDSTERKEQATDSEPATLKLGKGEPPPEIRRPNFKHNKIQTISLIRLSLWEKAKWGGMAFFMTKNGELPPTLALGFADAEAGAKIFAGWQKELGAEDKQERLRITIIRGISRANPHRYRAVIGTNLLKAGLKKQNIHFLLLCRTLVMDPQSDLNLSKFLEQYRRHGFYELCHAVMPSAGAPPDPVRTPKFIKRELTVRDAWQVGLNDPDAMGIHPGDDPVIPLGEVNPPVQELLAWMRNPHRNPGGTV